MATKPEAEEPAKAAPKSKKMLFIIVGVVVLALLGGGGGWFFLMKKNADSDEEEEVTKAVAHKGPPTFLPLDTMVVNLADPGGEKVAQIGVTLELSDPKATEKVKPYLPAIRSAILLKVSERTAEELLQREGKDKLAEDILEESVQIFTGGHAPEAPKGKKEGGKAKKKDPVDIPILKVLFSSFIVQ